jgi:IMP dehydrogenase
MVCSRDIDFIEDRSTTLDKVMSTDLLTAQESTSLEACNKVMQEGKKGKLPIVNHNFELVSLISRQDLSKRRDFPNASTDKATKQVSFHSWLSFLTFILMLAVAASCGRRCRHSPS